MDWAVVIINAEGPTGVIGRFRSFDRATVCARRFNGWAAEGEDAGRFSPDDHIGAYVVPMWGQRDEIFARHSFVTELQS